jgi:hypothetical protein
LQKSFHGPNLGVPHQLAEFHLIPIHQTTTMAKTPPIIIHYRLFPSHQPTLVEKQRLPHSRVLFIMATLGALLQDDRKYKVVFAAPTGYYLHPDDCMGIYEAFSGVFSLNDNSRQYTVDGHYVVDGSIARPLAAWSFFVLLKPTGRIVVYVEPVDN